MNMCGRVHLKTLYYCFGICVLMLFIFCNDRSGNQKHNLEATLDIMVYKDEVFQLFYKLNIDDAYAESLSIKRPVTANKDFQKVRFELPTGVRPKNIRIDFGDKPGLDSFRIREVSFRYKELRLIGDDQKFREWFNFNRNISYDSIRNIYYLKPDDKGFYDPQINGNETLNKRMVKLFPPDVNDVF